MSTPQTATALHHHHFHPPQYHYSDYNYPTNVEYRPNGSAAHNGQYSASLIPNNDSPNLRHASTATHATKQPSTNASIAYSARNSPEMPPATTKSQRKPNWENYFKNGVPEEIITIDDDTPEPKARPSKPKPNPAYTDARPTVAGAAAAHADKRRRVDPAAHYEPKYYPANETHRRRPWEDDSELSNSADSRGRSAATNPYSTAQTSLSSSTGSQRARLDNTQIGQKRKRVRERSSDSSSAVEIVSRTVIADRWGAYEPPPRPPIKASEVIVKPVNEHHPNNKCDDEDGHYVVVDGADLTKRYKIVRLLGQGTFGKVVEAYDRNLQKRCAIKIIRAVSKYRDASRIELRVLATLKKNDNKNRNRCIHLLECFDWRNHICIVTDLLSESVFDFLKRNTFTPFPSTHIQSFARQLFTSVAFLHDLNLIHTDLKPENILLVSNAYQTFTYNRTIPSSSRGTTRQSKQRRVLFDPEIRLIDFGSATFEEEYHSTVVSTRHYRAPEIILNLGWSFPCDIWSIGCILVEFFTGDALFQTHDNLEHLAMMEAVCGNAIDENIVLRVRDKTKRNAAAQYFRPRLPVLNFPNKDTPRQSKSFVKSMKKLEEIIPTHQSTFNTQFVDLLRRIFVYDPAKRINAVDALKHPWFGEMMQDDGTEAKKIQRDKEAKQRQNGYR